MSADLRSSELENAFIKERVSNVEKHINSICSKLSNYNKKLAMLKDCGDDFSKSLQNLISKETLNTSFKSAVHEISDILISLQNDRNIQIQRIDVNVIQELTNFDPLCKKTKDEFKRCYEAKLLAIKRRNQLQKLQAKNVPDLQKIALAEKDANLARNEATHASLEMSQKLNTFERKKLTNIKQILLDFVKIEMMFCAKAIEMYTTAYSSIKNIKVDEDLNEFMCHYKALTSSLDDQCLSAPHTKIQASKEKSKIGSLHIENTNVLSASKADLRKLNVSRSSLNSVPESNFGFGNETL